MHKRLRKLINTPFEVFATILYMLGIISKHDLYKFIGHLDSDLRAKLEKDDQKLKKQYE